MPTRVKPASFTAGRRLVLGGTALGPPTQTAPSTSTSGGTGLAATTQYFYAVTALNADGETLKSNEQNVTTGAGASNSNTVNWNAVSGATGYRVYRGLATGVYTTYYQVGAVTTKVDTGAAGTAGTPPLRDSTGDTVYNAGDTIPNAKVKVLKRLNMFMTRRLIIPNVEVYKKVHSTEAKYRRTPHPTSQNPRESSAL